MPILAVEAVHRRFGGLHAVNDVSFVVEPSVIKALIGPNGAGKTTLFNLIAGSLPVESGRITFQSTAIHGRKPHQIATLGISRTFQNIRLFPGMTVLENVMIGCHARTSAGFLAGMSCAPWTWREENRIRERALTELNFVGIAELAESVASSLSFGHQRAVELARALACEPKLLLLDEPASGLNTHETEALGRLIRRIRDRGITVLLVEHDMSLVMDICDEIVVLNSGVKVAEGTPQAIQNNEEVVRVYLGAEDADDPKS
ncbi:MAG TPA: ABC transporter ATP-binding protein [Planctomycetota bacterium]|jgi:branched-chain amino acid transport system ATP-binding protein